MCVFLVKNLFAVLIITIFWNILDEMVHASLDSVNNLNDIKTPFNHPNNSKVNEQLIKEKLEKKNFAEGGLIKSYSVTAAPINNASFTLQKDTSTKLSVETHQNDSNSSHIPKILKNKSENNSDVNASLNKSTTLTKLIDGGSNLFLGGPEVVHVNGTSSIKPRKGVYYNKIVPRKGVDPEYEVNHNTLNKCFSLGENECYATPTNIQHLETFCCNKTTADNNRKEMTSVNCSSCNLTEISYNKSCQFVCFRDLTDLKKIQEIQTEPKNNDDLDLKKILPKIATSKKTFLMDNPVEDSSASLNKKKFTSSFKKIKLKPKITKVPDDVEYVDDLFSRSKREVLMPVIVSIFLLPLIGLLIFFIWKRTKDYWSKRYYKRMDFLIDGMYNDQYS